MNYYSKTNYVSNSMLSALKGHFGDPTEAYKFGTLFDVLETEPEKLHAITRMIDDVTYTQEEIDVAKAMQQSLHNYPLYRMLRHGAVFQAEHYSENTDFKHNGWTWQMPTRCKTDLMHPTLIVDIKTTTAVTQKAFESAAANFDYDRQAAFYMNMLPDVKLMYIIGISKKYPYNVFSVKYERERHMGFEKMNELAFEFIESHGKNINYE